MAGRKRQVSASKSYAVVDVGNQNVVIVFAGEDARRRAEEELVRRAAENEFMSFGVVEWPSS